jgi:hypothetical protein
MSSLKCSDFVSAPAPAVNRIIAGEQITLVLLPLGYAQVEHADHIVDQLPISQ